jgi:hypothetical protein
MMRMPSMTFAFSRFGPEIHGAPGAFPLYFDCVRASFGCL